MLRTLDNVLVPPAFFEGGKGDKRGSAPALSAEDRLAILELVARFEWSFDSRNLDALASILTEDVILDHLFGYREGKAAAMQMLREDIPFKGIRHQATNPVVFVAEDGAPAVLSYLVVVQVIDDHDQTTAFPRVIAHALVTDHVRKEGGTWKISRRTFEQMSVHADYLPDPEARRKLARTAAQREADERR